MAHFYGTVKGPKGEASRLGSKVSGLTTVAASWGGAIKTHLYHDPHSGADRVLLELLDWPSGNRKAVLYDGPLAGLERHRLLQAVWGDTAEAGR